MTDPNTKVLEAVRAIAEAHGANNGETVDHMVIRMLAVAWGNAVRAEWQAFVDADPDLKAQHAVAEELRREDGYTMEQDPICMVPGTKPSVAVFEGKEIVCIDYSMTQVTPLSAIYVNKVRIVQSAAARVAKRLAEEAVKEPPSWPLTIASGETFNSIEEMEQCPIEAVKEMAKMMRDAERYQSQPAPHIPAWQDPSTPPTCWQYFGFEAPASLEDLHAKYRDAIAAAAPGDNKLAAEVHRQYQNCLREIGTAIMEGPVESETTSDPGHEAYDTDRDPKLN